MKKNKIQWYGIKNAQNGYSLITQDLDALVKYKYYNDITGYIDNITADYPTLKKNSYFLDFNDFLQLDN
jgi:hypothetical protein